MNKTQTRPVPAADPAIIALRIRGVVLMALCLAFLAIAAIRIGWVQYSYPNTYSELQLFNNVRTGTIPASRGRIFDTWGRPLADNRTTRSLFVNPSRVNPEDRDALVLEIHNLLGLDLETTRTALYRSESYRQILIRDMSGDDLANWEAVPEYGPTADLMREVGVMSQEARVYPLGPIAGPVIGFTSARDEGQIGLWGLECRYDDVLAGRPGRYEDQRDQRGQRIPGSRNEIAAPRNGSDLVLTIDADIQALAEIALERGLEATNAKGGTVIITEPSNGAVRALVTLPAVDPSSYQDYLEDENAMFSSSTCLSYEPGSVLKVFTIAAGLEEDTIIENQWFHVGPGPLSFRGGTVPDHEYGPSDIDLREVCVHSSNRGAAIIAVGLGHDVLSQYLRDLGFGSRTELQMPGEPSGDLKDWLVPFPEIDLANMGFGHGITVSPLQLVQAVGVFANDGMLVPLRLIQARRDPPWGAETEVAESVPRRVISVETSRIVQDFMVGVVEEGTAMQAATEWPSAGKTGTAQKIDTENGGYSQTAYYATFVGYGPVPNPRWLILVILDEPEWPYFGGYACGPIYREIFNALMLREGQSIEDMPELSETGTTAQPLIIEASHADGEPSNHGEYVLSPDPFGDDGSNS